VGILKIREEINKGETKNTNNQGSKKLILRKDK
jgi:hypothetical protein